MVALQQTTHVANALPMGGYVIIPYVPQFVGLNFSL